MHLPFFASEGFANVFHHQRFTLYGSPQSLYLLLRLSIIDCWDEFLYTLECLNHLDAFHVYLDAFHVYNFFMSLIFVGQGYPRKLPYNGNHLRKKSFTNFANLEAFANVFLHFLSRPEFLYKRLPESRKFSRELRQRRQIAKLFFCG